MNDCLNVRGLLHLLLGATLSCACSRSEPPVTFKRVFRATVENSPNRGYAWVHRKPQQRIARGRYEGGVDADFNSSLGVCRAKYKDGLHPGKIFADRCNLSWGGKEVIVDEFDVLIARSDAFWHIAPKPNMDLKPALVGGHEADGRPLYVCVARYEEGWAIFKSDHGHHPGKYVAGKCLFGWGGNEVASDDFYILATGTPVATPTPPAAGVECTKNEVGCSCETFSGCSLPGYCQCPS
jgi:hypothetical protein